MVRVEDLRDIVEFYLRRAAWDMLESLYLFALHFDSYDVKSIIEKKNTGAINHPKSFIKG